MECDLVNHILGTIGLISHHYIAFYRSGAKCHQWCTFYITTKVMFIKTNKRFSKKRRCDNLQFSVVESFRENGKVKHRTLAYLGTIPEDAFKYAHWLERFWKESEQNLQSFTEADRTQLIARLETIVPRPSEEMNKAVEQRMRDLEAIISRR